jgi:hypothetical protein
VTGKVQVIEPVAKVERRPAGVKGPHQAELRVLGIVMIGILLIVVIQLRRQRPGEFARPAQSEVVQREVLVYGLELLPKVVDLMRA